MCVRTLSEIAKTICVAIVIFAFAIAEQASAAAETCEYDIDNVTSPSGKTLLMTKYQFLQTPVDPNASHTVLSAARLRFSDPPAERRYLRVSFVLVELVETEDEAKSRRGLTRVLENMPLVIELADESTLMLAAWSKDGGRNNSKIERPSELGNSSKLFRVSHYAGGSYWLNDDQVAILLEQPATKLQVTTTQGDLSVVIHPSRTDRIQYVLGCI
jgi:hypothetical protein